MRKTIVNRLAAGAVSGFALFTSPAAMACATCFGEADAPQTKGMSLAILTLLGCTGAVLTGAVGFVGSIAWRIHAMESGNLVSIEPSEPES
ncbi:MAG: hypothetical protein AMXMBFR84_19710 [Candidatus Hydrogenedentota bacterium]